MRLALTCLYQPSNVLRIVMKTFSMKFQKSTSSTYRPFYIAVERALSFSYVSISRLHRQEQPMDAQLNCATCGATFHQYNPRQKYCSATCRNKALYANRKYQLATVEQLFSIAEELARSEERVKQLEAQLKDRNEENEALRTTIQQLTSQLIPSPSSTPSRYHIELRKMSITQVLDQPYSNYYLDHRGNKTISTDSIYLSSYASNGALLSEQEIKGNDELLYLMERHNITDIELSAGL
jgi:hypothetical protein